MADPGPFGLRFRGYRLPQAVGEFRAALGNDYFRERFETNDLMEIVASVEEIATRYDDPKEIPALLRDPDGNYLVELGRKPGADAISTGDR